MQWMTLQELRNELGRTRPAWDAAGGDLDGVLAEDQLLVVGQDAQRLRLIQNELLPRPNNG